MSCLNGWSYRMEQEIVSVLYIYVALKIIIYLFYFDFFTGTLISDSLPGRTGKQCRERWHNHLSEGIKKGDWTEEEDKIITTMRLAIGNQWSKVRL